jgi:hypothetical protein
MKRAQEILRDAERFGKDEQLTRIRDAVAILGYAMALMIDI